MQHVDGTGPRPKREGLALSDIDPTRWADALGRVAVLRKWCVKSGRSMREGEDAAARMGVSVSRFERLVTAWRKHVA